MLPEPIHYWNFNEESGAAIDSIGGLRARVESSAGPWSVAGKWQNAMRMGKATGAKKVEIKRPDGASPPDLAPPWTVAVWIKRHEGATGGATLLCSDGFAIKIEQYGTGSKLGVTQRGGGIGDRSIEEALPSDAWSHLALVATDAGTTFYIDGVDKGTLPSIKAPMAYLGGTRNSWNLTADPDEMLEATIEELRIYNKALRPEEVRELVGLEPEIKPPPPPPPLPFEKLPLQSVLDAMLGNVPELTKNVPFPWSITYDVNTEGTALSDGGTDMFDIGNILATESGTLTYSNGIIKRYGPVGPKGAYFTLLLRQMFVAVVDLDDRQSFGTRGQLGADGGSVDGTVLTATVDGAKYRGFVKRVYGTSDPSVNHLFIVRDDAGAVKHAFPNDVARDEHTLTGLSQGCRVYYLMFGSRYNRIGQEVAYDSFQKIMEALFSLLKAQAAQPAQPAQSP